MKYRYAIAVTLAITAGLFALRRWRYNAAHPMIAHVTMRVHPPPAASLLPARQAAVPPRPQRLQTRDRYSRTARRRWKGASSSRISTEIST